MAKTKISPYKTYRFIDKDPVIDEVRTAVEDSGLSYVEIGAKVGRKHIASTLHGWFQGGVRRPQHASVQAVLIACGKRLIVVDAIQARARKSR